MSHGSVEVVQRAIDALNRRDIEALRALSHPEIEVDWSASRGLEPRVYRGWDEIMGFYQNLFESFEPIHVKPDRLIDAGDSVVVPYSAEARGRHGVDTVARSALVYEVRGGRVARVCLYQETAQALEAAELRE
jgi:ketosteroid isomerase-like protein